MSAVIPSLANVKMLTVSEPVEQLIDLVNVRIVQIVGEPIQGVSRLHPGARQYWPKGDAK